MAVSMGLRNKLTDEYRDIPIATLSSFRGVWLPLCEQIGLLWVPMFAGGALTSVPEQLIPEIIRELHSLSEVVVAAHETEWIAERITSILAAFEETNPAEWEYGFG